MANRNTKRLTNESAPEIPITLGDYQIGKFHIFILKGQTLGEGTFGKVKLGTHHLTNQKVLNLESKLIGRCKNIRKR